MRTGMRWALAVSGLLVCGAIRFSPASIPAADQPVLVLPVRHWTVGDITPSALAMPVRNAGTRRLVLNELDLACGCGHKVLRTIVVSPGETVVVQIPCDSKLAPEEFPEIASFTTNDPAHSRFDLLVGESIAVEKHPRTNPNQKLLLSVDIRP
jgi:hypothetical protein